MQTTQTKKTWRSALNAFADRRAGIMFLLGFSAGIPIFLIFSTLSFWLMEAGIARSTVTLFSLATLGYSFKFIWAPLIDKLPLPYLTRWLGQRRSWLLLAQLLVILAIVLMSMTNPSPQADYFDKVSNVTLMAMAAIFLGFSSATQDIVIDAYRIELSDQSDVQTVLASTYNAGYRIATIITQMGALLFAASLGTALGNYIYEAWQSTYLLMASLMLLGIITTFCIKEPVAQRQQTLVKSDYVHLIATFVLSTVLFATTFYYLNQGVQSLIQAWSVQDPLLRFAGVVLTFLGSLVVSITGVWSIIKLGIIQQQIVVETWIAPLLDFFKRYGIKVALAILLLIGFYRISDIVAGTIANLFYLDLNFDKEEIAWFNKLFAVAFVILGGFIGGILAQRYAVMKMLLLGAIVASTTNLIFVGLVKSGATMNTVHVQVADKQYQVQPDEVGKWSLAVPADDYRAWLSQPSQSVTVTTQPEGLNPLKTHTVIKLYQAQSSTPTVYVEPIFGQNHLYQDQLLRDVIVQGSVVNLSPDAIIEQVNVSNQSIQQSATIDLKNQRWSVVLNGKELAQQAPLHIDVTYKINQQRMTLHHVHDYQVLPQVQPNVRLSVENLPATEVSHQQTVELKGKVIVPYSKWWLVAGIIFDNLASGLAGAVFIAFLSSLTSISFTAMQYALFTSLMLLLPKTIGAYSGAIVNHLGYSGFFSLTFAMGVPIFFLVIWVAKLLSNHRPSK